MIANTLDQREKTHGKYIQTANLTQAIMVNMEFSKNWNALSPCQKEALHMIAMKVARILEGNPDEADHWHDIAGYAALAEDYVNKLPQLNADDD